MGRWAAVAIAITLVGAGTARAGRRANMPEGWTWPPSKEMRRDGRKCLAELREMGVQFERARRRRKIATPVVVPDMKFGALTLRPTFRKPPFVMDCRLALVLARYAGLITALGVSELGFSSIHDYRAVRTRKGGGALSRHALGLAIDVFEVGLAGGARVVVEEQYWLHPTLLLTELGLRATGGFRAILSPSVDPESHRDHLHLEVAVEFPQSAKELKKKKRKKKKKKKKRRRRRAKG